MFHLIIVLKLTSEFSEIIFYYVGGKIFPFHASTKFIVYYILVKKKKKKKKKKLSQNSV